MTTVKLELPELQASQSQPHIPINTSLRRLEAVTQVSVLSAILTAPPGSPAEGEYWIVASPATGAWLGREDDIAYLSGGAWVFVTPIIGWIAYDQDADEYLSFSGSAWAVLATGGGGGGEEGHAAFVDLVISANAITLDIDAAGYFRLLLTANVNTVNYSNVVSGDLHRFQMLIKQDGTGGRTFTPPSSWRYPSGVGAYSPSSGADDVDLVEGVSYNGGDTWLISYEKDYV